MGDRDCMCVHQSGLAGDPAVCGGGWTIAWRVEDGGIEME